MAAAVASFSRITSNPKAVCRSDRNGTPSSIGKLGAMSIFPSRRLSIAGMAAPRIVIDSPLMLLVHRRARSVIASTIAFESFSCGV
jgi:hypothetical protein